LNLSIPGLIKTLSRLIGENIDLRFEPCNDLHAIKLDPSQLDQILINLVVNARDAMPAGGRLTIETANLTLDETDCQEHLEIDPRRYVLMSVSDTGSGMDEDTLGHVFEPFFTTKEESKGTGLGLATVYGIVRQNQGFIEAISIKGEGSTFKVYFPVIDAGTRAIDAHAPPRPRTGSGTILLDEDDDMVRRMTRAMLTKMGYTVLAAESPISAVSICKNMDQPIDLLLTDLLMPEMSGKELKSEIEQIRPSIKSCYMSGYTSNIIGRHGVLDEGVNFIQKPFGLQDLAQKIHQVLNDR